MAEGPGGEATAEGSGREPGSEAGWAVVEAAAAAARELLGDALASAYAIGSLGHGGFAAATSDVDLALLTSGGEEVEVPAERIAGKARRAVPDPLAERLSIFHAAWDRFGDPPAGSRFPAIDRLDLMRSGVLLLGEDLRGELGVEPPQEEVLGNSINSALVRNTPAELRAQVDGIDPAELDGRSASKLVLWPVRLLHTIDTASAAGNVEAAEHYRDGATPEPRHVALVESALSWREAGEIADKETATESLRSELLPLYAEIYGALAHRPDVPRADEITSRATAFAAATD